LLAALLAPLNIFPSIALFSPSLVASTTAHSALRSLPLTQLPASSAVAAGLTEAILSIASANGGALLAPSAPINATAPTLLCLRVAASSEPLTLQLSISAFGATPEAAAAGYPGFSRAVITGAASARWAAVPPADSVVGRPKSVGLSVISSQWALLGEPLSGVLGQGSGLPASHTPPIPSACSPALVCSIPPGTLLPGYAYTASVRLSMSLFWMSSSAGNASFPAWADSSPFLYPSSAQLDPNDPGLTLNLNARAPVAILAHAPPQGGGLALSPLTGGMAFTGSFSLSTAPGGGFIDADGLSTSSDEALSLGGADYYAAFATSIVGGQGLGASFLPIGRDVAAMQGDCPYARHGNGENLTACKVACAVLGASVCNVINWNPTKRDCVYRLCSDPLHPALATHPGYSVYAMVSASSPEGGASNNAPWLGALSLLATGQQTPTPAALYTSISSAIQAALARATAGGSAGSQALLLSSQRFFCDVGGPAAASLGSAGGGSMSSWPFGLEAGAGGALTKKGYAALLNLQSLEALPGVLVASSPSSPFNLAPITSVSSSLPGSSVPVLCGLLARDVLGGLGLAWATGSIKTPDGSLASSTTAVQEALSASAAAVAADARAPSSPTSSSMGSLSVVLKAASDVSSAAVVLASSLASPSSAAASSALVATAALQQEALVTTLATYAGTLALTPQPFAASASLADGGAPLPATSSTPSLALSSMAAAMASLTSPNTVAGLGGLLPLQVAGTALTTASSLAMLSTGSLNASSASAPKQGAPPPSAAEAAAVGALCSSVLAVVSNVLAFTAVTPPEPAPPKGYSLPPGTTPVTTAAKLLPTGGTAAELSLNASLALFSVMSALVAKAPPPSANQEVSTLPSTFASSKSYCGAGMSMAVLSFAPPSAASSSSAKAPLTIKSPLPPCSAASTAALALIAVPPPSLALSPAAHAAFSAAAAAAAKSGLSPPSLGIAQWGISPHAESVGGCKFKSLEAASDKDAREYRLGRMSRNDGGRRALWSWSLAGSAGRLLQAMLPGVASGASGDQPPLPLVASHDTLVQAVPRKEFSEDFLPLGPMATRTISITLGGAGGGPSPGAVQSLPGPVTLVLPLRDPAALVYTSPPSYAIGQNGFPLVIINVTCPAGGSPLDSKVKAAYVSGGVGTPSVSIASILYADFTTALEAEREARPEGAGVSSGILDDAMGANQDPGGASSLAASLQPSDLAGSALKPFRQATYILSVDCGAAFGGQKIICGIGVEGQPRTFSCPRVAAVPVCMWHNPSTGTWTPNGTSLIGGDVSGLPPTSFACNTSLAGDHAVRLVALPAIQSDVFSELKRAENTKSISSNWNIVGFFAIGLLYLAGTLLHWGSQRARRKAFETALASDALVRASQNGLGQWASAILAKGGGPGRKGDTALVAPLPSPSPDKGASSPQASLEARGSESSGSGSGSARPRPAYALPADEALAVRHLGVPLGKLTDPSQVLARVMLLLPLSASSPLQLAPQAIVDRWRALALAAGSHSSNAGVARDTELGGGGEEEDLTWHLLAQLGCSRFITSLQWSPLVSPVLPIFARVFYRSSLAASHHQLPSALHQLVVSLLALGLGLLAACLCRLAFSWLPQGHPLATVPQSGIYSLPPFSSSGAQYILCICCCSALLWVIELSLGALLVWVGGVSYEAPPPASWGLEKRKRMAVEDALFALPTASLLPLAQRLHPASSDGACKAGEGQLSTLLSPAEISALGGELTAVGMEALGAAHAALEVPGAPLEGDSGGNDSGISRLLAYDFGPLKVLDVLVLVPSAVMAWLAAFEFVPSFVRVRGSVATKEAAIVAIVSFFLLLLLKFITEVRAVALAAAGATTPTPQSAEASTGEGTATIRGSLLTLHLGATAKAMACTPLGVKKLQWAVIFGFAQAEALEMVFAAARSASLELSLRAALLECLYQALTKGALVPPLRPPATAPGQPSHPPATAPLLPPPPFSPHVVGSAEAGSQTGGGTFRPYSAPGFQPVQGPQSKLHVEDFLLQEASQGEKSEKAFRNAASGEDFPLTAPPPPPLKAPQLEGLGSQQGGASLPELRPVPRRALAAAGASALGGAVSLSALGPRQ
jgi:hypothetical protein